MVSTSTKIGHGLAKVLGIKLEEHRAPVDPVTRGESAYSVDTADTYIEDEPHTLEWLHDLVPSGHDVGQYFINLFPFTKWITRYNAQWALGDLIAGVTIGAVVVPQGMAYASLAKLAPEYGLYTSFMGVLIYWFFATSKDITIGPVAVMSTIVGNVVIKVQKEAPDIEPYTVAGALAIICGGIICAIGLLRLGRIVDFIPLSAISAFMTGSALNICMGQMPNLFGIKDSRYNTREPTYKVFINFWRFIYKTKIDVAPGLTALFMLYAIRSLCNYLSRKHPDRKKLFFFISTLRTVFVILLYTLISWAVNRNHRTPPRFALLGNVPRGFKHARVPVVNSRTISLFASELPSSVIVLLIEHIAISKSFGRVNNYVIDPSQELVAIGVTNLLGPFLGAYPATGSFSRTAIKSKAGVRTPLAGVITAIVVLLAIYALPAVFYYIPTAPLAAVIIHAVGDLITPPNTVYQFYRVAPIEVIVFFAGVLVTIFSSIDYGVYTTVCLSAAILLWRVLFAKGTFVGRVQVHSVVGDHLLEDKQNDHSPVSRRPKPDDGSAARNIFLPIQHNDGSNPSIQIEHPYPGVFIYRFSEGFNYPNANNYLDHLTHYVFEHTRRTTPNAYPRLGDRPWNDPGPPRGQPEPDRSHLPTLKAVIIDFASVNNVDITSVQNLIDVRNQLDRYTTPEKVQWHFAGIKNKWAKRGLAAAGFGYPSPLTDSWTRVKPIFSVADIGGRSSAAAAAEWQVNQRASRATDIEAVQANKTDQAFEIRPTGNHDSSSDEIDLQKQITNSKAYNHTSVRQIAVVGGLNRPFFHSDLTSAVQSAVAIIEDHDPKRGVGTEQLKI